MIPFPSERGISPRPELKMVRDVDPRQLAGIIGGEVYVPQYQYSSSERPFVSPAILEARVVVVNLPQLGIRIWTDADGRLDHLTFEDNRPAVSLRGGMAVELDPQLNMAIFVSAPRNVSGGSRVMDTMMLSKEAYGGPSIVSVESASSELMEMAQFAEEHSLPVMAAEPSVADQY